MHLARRTCSSVQKTGTSCAPTIAGERWYEVSGNLPSDFGFVVDIHARAGHDLMWCPIKERLREHYPPEGKLRVESQRSGGNEWGSAHQRLAAIRMASVLRRHAAWD